MNLSPTIARLGSVAIEIIGTLIRTPLGHRYIIVVTDRFTKLVKAIQMKAVSTGEVSKLFVVNWVLNDGPTTALLSDKGPQDTSKLFMNICRILNTRNVLKTTYNPQTKRQAERFNRTILASLPSYNEDHPRDRDLYTPVLRNAYNS